jgi:hypothetical protein
MRVVVDGVTSCDTSFMSISTFALGFAPTRWIERSRAVERDESIPRRASSSLISTADGFPVAS